jgi:cyclase
MAHTLRCHRWFVLVAIVLAGGAGIAFSSATRVNAQDAGRPTGARYTGKAFTFNEVAPGVYHAVGTGALSVGCNASIVVNADDVLVVDTHMTPGGAWALREELKALTPKPVRYVINTHWHFDHAHGNQIYGPGVEIIGHEYTRARLAAGDSKRGRSYDLFIGGVPAQITQLKDRIAKSADAAERRATRRTREPFRRHADRYTHATHGHAHRSPHALPRRPRDSPALPGPRAHRR